MSFSEASNKYSLLKVGDLSLLRFSLCRKRTETAGADNKKKSYKVTETFFPSFFINNGNL